MQIREELVGVPRSVAARVIGINERRLWDWNDNGMIQPSQKTRIGGRSVWTFTFDDLVQGRTLKELENRGAHIRSVRRLVEAVTDGKFRTPLSQLHWAVGGHEVFVGYPDGNWYGGRKPTQAVMRDILDLDDIRNQTRKALQRPKEDAGQTERRRGAMGSQELFAGTRVPIESVVRYLEHGFSNTRILQAFPSLTKADIALARQRLLQKTA